MSEDTLLDLNAGKMHSGKSKSPVSSSEQANELSSPMYNYPTNSSVKHVFLVLFGCTIVYCTYKALFHYVLFSISATTPHVTIPHDVSPIAALSFTLPDYF